MSRLEEVEGAALSAVVEERQAAAERATAAARQALEATEARGAARQAAEEAAAGRAAGPAGPPRGRPPPVRPTRSARGVEAGRASRDRARSRTGTSGRVAGGV